MSSASFRFAWFTLLALLTVHDAYSSVLRVPLERRLTSLGGNATTKNGGDLISVSDRSSAQLHFDVWSWAFIGPIYLGTPKKKFMVNFDTGSSKLWVFDLCAENLLGKTFRHNFYDKSESKSYKSKPMFKKKQMSIHYVDGRQFRGEMGRETLQIGNAHYIPIIVPPC